MEDNPDTVLTPRLVQVQVPRVQVMTIRSTMATIILRPQVKQVKPERMAQQHMVSMEMAKNYGRI